MGMKKTSKRKQLTCDVGRLTHVRTTGHAPAHVTRLAPIMTTFVSLSKESGFQKGDDTFCRNRGKLQQKVLDGKRFWGPLLLLDGDSTFLRGCQVNKGFSAYRSNKAGGTARVRPPLVR